MTDCPLPRHVAFIMDGNGRWAEARGLPRALGHQAGAETVRRVTTYAARRGISYLTLYAFSTENWARPQPEVDALMALLGTYIEAELPTLQENGIELRSIGDMSRLSAELRDRFAHAEAESAKTANAGGLVLTLAINYGGRNEIARAAGKAARKLAETGCRLEDLDEKLLAEHLDTARIPDPDLLVRTAGEMRLSNFLIWQAAYAEFIFTPTTWPDFSDEDFEAALAEYGRRTRKFGGGV